MGAERSSSAFRTGSAPIDRVRCPRASRFAGVAMDPLFMATVDATEEAVLNALLASPTVVGRGGHAREGLPADDVVALVMEHAHG